jgi:hypothetical protein
MFLMGKLLQFLLNLLFGESVMYNIEAFRKNMKEKRTEIIKEKSENEIKKNRK